MPTRDMEFYGKYINGHLHFMYCGEMEFYGCREYIKHLQALYRWQMEFSSISRLHVMPCWNMELHGCREYIKHM